MEGDLFLSYSREDFRFTREVNTYLRSIKQATWFDVQRLMPGMDWHEEIERGLTNCAALLLFASQAALNSPYVRAEWERVSAAGKPIYVVALEPVTLPPALSPAATINGAQKFAVVMEKLRQIVIEQKPIHDSLPNRLNLRFLTNSRALSLVLAMLIGIGIWTVVIFGTKASQSLPVIALYIAAVLMQLLILWRLLHRAASPQWITIGLVTAFAPLVLVAMLYGAFIVPLSLGMQGGFGQIFVGLVFLGAIFGIERLSKQLQLQLDHRDFERWYSRSVPYIQNEMVTRRFTLKEPVVRKDNRDYARIYGAAPCSARFTIQGALEDGQSSAQIARALTENGHHLVEQEPADIQIVVLSEYTRLDELQSASAQAKMPLVIVAGNIAAKALAAFFPEMSRLQYIDVRTNFTPVYAFAHIWAYPNARDYIDFYAPPQRLEQAILPRMVRNLVLRLRFSYLVAFTLLAVVMANFSALSAYPFVILYFAVMVALEFMALWLAYRIAARAISQEVKKLLALVATLLCAAPLAVPFALSGVGVFPLGDERFNNLLGFATMIYFFLSLLRFGIRNAARNEANWVADWLPKSASADRTIMVLSRYTHPLWWYLARDFAIVFLAALVVALLSLPR